MERLVAAAPARHTLDDDKQYRDNYECLNCHRSLRLESRDSVKCPHCGYRILLKMHHPGQSQSTLLAR